MADPQQYFLRIDGKIRGPFQMTQVSALVARGRVVAAAAEISADRRTWYRLQDCPQVLVPAAPPLPKPSRPGSPPPPPRVPTRAQPPVEEPIPLAEPAPAPQRTRQTVAQAASARDTLPDSVLPLPLAAAEEPDYEITLDAATRPAQQQPPPGADNGDWFGDVDFGKLGDV